MEKIFGTVDENFKAALQEEQIMIACGPHDPYWRIAKMNVNYYLNCAAALERGETHIQTLRDTSKGAA